ncbi:MAG: DUF2007 domain-containing protein [Marinoscillum sp.]
MSLSELATFDNSLTANMLKTKLEIEGIPCFLNNENFTNMMPLYFNMLGSGVRVMVPTDQLERAKEIAKIESGKLSCPNCESTKIMNSVERTTNKLKLALIAIFLALPIGNLLNNYSCQDCEHQFKK